MPLKAVLFDLWETLIHDIPARAQPRRARRAASVCEVLARHDFAADEAEVLAALDATSARLGRLHDSGLDLPGGGRARLFIEELEALTGRRASESAVPGLEDAITAMPLEIAPTAAPHAVETVAAVKELGLSTALVCNTGFTTTPHLLPMLERYGLSSHLDVQVFSDQLEVAKPDPRIFSAALEGLGLAAADCLFVGDNPHTDISGAQGVGLYAVQIGAKTRDGVTPDARIDRLDELIAVVKQRLQ